MSGRSPPLYYTLTLIVIQGHQKNSKNKGNVVPHQICWCLKSSCPNLSSSLNSSGEVQQTVVSSRWAVRLVLYRPRGAPPVNTPAQFCERSTAAKNASRNQPTAMNLYFLDWVRTQNQRQNRTRDAHKISPHGTMTKRQP